MARAVVTVALFWSPAARAGDEALAESLFREGRALMEAGNYTEGCAKLAESYRQDPATGALLALAACEEAAGKTASAWVHFSEAASAAGREGRADRKQAAEEHMRALESKLSRLVVNVEGTAAQTPGLEVRKDGIVLGRAAWGSAAPVDPGEHVIEAHAPGKRPFVTKVVVGPSADQQQVEIFALEADDTAPESKAMPPGAPTDAGKSLRIAGIVTGSGGILALGLGAYFGLHARALNNESNENHHCDANGVCDDQGLAKRDDAIKSATYSTVSTIAGLALVAGGVSLFLVGRSHASSERVALQVAPVIGPGVAGLSLTGRAW